MGIHARLVSEDQCSQRFELRQSRHQGVELILAEGVHHCRLSLLPQWAGKGDGPASVLRRLHLALASITAGTQRDQSVTLQETQILARRRAVDADLLSKRGDALRRVPAQDGA